MTTPLQRQLDACNAQAMSQLPAALLQGLTGPIERLRASGAARQALREGAKAPDFTLSDEHGNPVTLSRLLLRGPVVITFYRGVWCPYCALVLRAYQWALPQIRELGASLVAISPQTPEHGRAMAEENGLTFALLSDAGNEVARQFGLVYPLDAAEREAYRRTGADLPAFNGDGSWELPITGTFIVDQTGTVLMASVDPDFTHGLDPSAIVARLFAHLASVVIEQTQRLERTQRFAALEERQRLARDLHDSLTQTLFGLQAVAQAALDCWEARPEQARAAVETIQQLARGASVEMRTLLFDLRDEALQREGLASALEKHAAMVRRQSGLAVELAVAADLVLPAGHEEALYRIVQEALSNVVKHARARRVGIAIAPHDGWVGVRIEDDGVGFPAEGPGVDTFGLRGMCERVQALGGRIEVGNRGGGGAYVSAEFPL